MKSQQQYAKVYSVELFPPRTAETAAALPAAIDELAALAPAFFSVTFGAGGSTRQGTVDTVRLLKGKGLEAAPHISCIDATREGVRELLDTYIGLGIGRLVALRGDLPPGGPNPGQFRHADELVAFIRAETGRHFHIEVAAYPEFHPEAPSPAADLQSLARKIAAGADGAMTQYFYNADAYFRFVADCEAVGLGVPIVPGIMPITNYRQLARFSDACGAEIPRWIRRRLEGYGEDLEAIREFGLEVTVALCERLLAGGAPGLHFYTLNKAGPTAAIWRQLRL